MFPEGNVSHFQCMVSVSLQYRLLPPVILEVLDPMILKQDSNLALSRYTELLNFLLRLISFSIDICILECIIVIEIALYFKIYVFLSENTWHSG